MTAEADWKLSVTRLTSVTEITHTKYILRHLIDRFFSFYRQTPVQSTVDIQQQQQQPQQQQLIGPQVLLQVQEDLRKLLEQRQAEEEKVRKELEGKVHALQRDSDKYRSELEHAQKEAENYRGRLEVERRENSRLSQLYQAAKQPASNSAAEDHQNWQRSFNLKRVVLFFNKLLFRGWVHSDDCVVVQNFNHCTNFISVDKE